MAKSIFPLFSFKKNDFLHWKCIAYTNKNKIHNLGLATIFCKTVINFFVTVFATSAFIIKLCQIWMVYY